MHAFYQRCCRCACECEQKDSFINKHASVSPYTPSASATTPDRSPCSHRSLSQAEADLYHNAFKGEQEALLQVPFSPPASSLAPALPIHMPYLMA